jgi:hypothetical protein
MRIQGLLVLGALAGCGHGAGGGGGPPALAAQEKVVDSECSAYGRASDACCAALAGEGDVLVASGQRDAALAAYERALQRCPRYDPVHRQLFLCRHPEAASASNAATREIEMGLTYHPRLGDDLLMIWHEAFIDGSPIGIGPIKLASRRVHEIEAGVFLQPFDVRDGPVTIMRTRRALILPDTPADEGPLVVRVQVRVHDRGGSSSLETRVAPEVVVEPIRSKKAIADAEKAATAERAASAPPLLRPQITKGMLLTRPSIPPGLTQLDGGGWAMLKLCVSAVGQVEDVSVLRATNPALTGGMVRTVYTWRYRPYQVDGGPVPFCTLVRFEVNIR